MADLIMMYHFHNLSDKAKKVAESKYVEYLLSRFFFNKDGTKFEMDNDVHKECDPFPRFIK